MNCWTCTPTRHSTASRPCSASAAAICWLAWLWRKYRGSQRAPHLLLVIMYIGSVSLGNHLMSLLVGPALIGFMFREMRLHPLSDPRERRVEFAQLAVVTGTWALLVGTGMGNMNLLILGAVIFLAAAVYAGLNGALGFALFVLSDLLDSADGQLARLRGTSTRLGRGLDGIGDSLRFVSLYAHLLIRVLWTGLGWWGAGLVLAALGSHTLQSATVDFVRNAFLNIGAGKGEADLPEDVPAERPDGWRGLLISVSEANGVFYKYMVIYSQRKPS